MLARRANCLQPRLKGDALEWQDWLAASLGFENRRGDHRPFRAPHYTVSIAGMRGRGARPGELSLAHDGVLFLDEAAEFSVHVLHTVTQALRLGRVHHGPSWSDHYHWPASFQLVVHMLPCPCGYRGHRTRKCECTDAQVAAYWNRIDILRPFLPHQATCVTPTMAQLTAQRGDTHG